MPSAKQLAANRANAQKSTGPVTDSGKSVVATNALKHGFYSQSILIEGESQEQFDQFRADMIADYGAQGAAEIAIVEGIVVNEWKLRRLHRIEAGYLNQDPEPRWKDTNVAGTSIEARAVWKFENRGDALERLSTFQVRLENGIARAIRSLERLRKLKEKYAEARSSQIEVQLKEKTPTEIKPTDGHPWALDAETPSTSKLPEIEFKLDPIALESQIGGTNPISIEAAPSDIVQTEPYTPRDSSDGAK